MSSNSSVFGQGECPSPFLQENLFPTTGGCMYQVPSRLDRLATDNCLVVNGRFCSALLGPTCCLPCPQTEWLYPDNFDSITQSASWINVAGVICSVFLLVSFAFLPIGKTHRHYLSVCLTIAVILMQVSYFNISDASFGLRLIFESWDS
jgi:hypothetical protein